MKVLAINSSPNMDKGNTALLLKPFLEGMQGAGAETELIYTRKLDIKPCLGCFNCWLKTPGKCVHRDDMDMVLPKIKDADIWILATPLYVDGMTGPMKNLIDRCVPLAEPFFEMRDGHFRHIPRPGDKKGGKTVLVSNCGFWERDNFEPLVNHIKAICRNHNREFAGALLRPHGPVLGYMIELGMPVDDVLKAANDAGRQLVQTGKISDETLDTISRELIPREIYFEQANKHFREELSKI